METEVSEVVEDDSQESQGLEEVHQVQEVLDETYESVGLASPNSSGILGNISVRGKYYKQTYRPAWEQMPDFKGWLRGVVGQPTRAYCIYCQKTLHAHRLSLLKHTCTIRHQKAAQIHNTRKNKKSMIMEGQDVHTVVLQEEELNATEVEPDDSETIEYSEAVSEPEEDDINKEGMQETVEEEEDEDEESTMQLQHQVSFEKHTSSFQLSHVKCPISTFVSDTTKGVPVFGLQVSLYKLIDGRWTYINEGTTNSSGRFSNFIERRDFNPGRYKLHYDVDRYFESRKQDTLYPFIEIIFDCQNVNESYHIPVLLSPFGYSTYRGS